MTDYFTISMSDEDILKISSLGLAHMGDAVYEIMVRAWLCMHGKATSRGLHFATVSYVAAPAQAKAVKIIFDSLSETEISVYRRGKNAKVNSVPNRSTLEEYHAATGLEALFGYLYLKGEKDRLNELFGQIMEDEKCR